MAMPSHSNEFLFPCLTMHNLPLVLHRRGFGATQLLSPDDGLSVPFQCTAFLAYTQ